MANQRKAGKRMIGFYASKEEADAMQAAAAAAGMTLSDWLRSLIPATKTSPNTAKEKGTVGKP